MAPQAASGEIVDLVRGDNRDSEEPPRIGDELGHGRVAKVLDCCGGERGRHAGAGQQ
jgi:hypothetical protein